MGTRLPLGRGTSLLVLIRNLSRGLGPPPIRFYTGVLSVGTDWTTTGTLDENWERGDGKAKTLDCEMSHADPIVAVTDPQAPTTTH